MPPGTVSVGLPSPQSIVQDVIVSSPGSLAERFTVYVAPSFTEAAPVTVSVGFTFVTLTVWVSVADCPSLPVTVNKTSYVPSSSGVKVRSSFEPPAKKLPFLVTVHSYVIGATADATPSSVTGAPSAAPEGPLMLAKVMIVGSPAG